jgi:hypothetical protein
LKEARVNIELLRAKKVTGWWEWWFDSKSDGKKVAGGIIFALLFGIIASILLPIPQLGWGYSDEITTVTFKPILVNSEPVFSNKTVTTQYGNVTTNITNTTDITTMEAKITNITTTETNYNMPIPTETTTKKTSPIGTEIKLLFAALLVFLLIHPQIKTFAAGTIKFDLEPIAASKGASELELRVA